MLHAVVCGSPSKVECLFTRSASDAERRAIGPTRPDSRGCDRRPGNNRSVGSLGSTGGNPLKKAALTVVLLVASALLGQSAAPPPAPSPRPAAPAAGASRPDSTHAMPPVSERVEVSVTNVKVIVTDSKGHRVPDLTKDDFEVFQAGVPQTISNFYAVTGGKVLLED